MRPAGIPIAARRPISRPALAALAMQNPIAARSRSLMPAASVPVSRLARRQIAKDLASIPAAPARRPERVTTVIAVANIAARLT